MTRPADDTAALRTLGWDERFEAALAAAPGTPGRVVRVDRGGHLNLATAQGPLRARLAPVFRGASATQVPTVGDWVAVGDERLDGLPVVDALLPRRSAIVRRAPEDRAADAQVLAANVDVAFIVAALDAADDGRGVLQRRLDRYVALVWDSGATPVVVLSKADRVADPASVAAAVAAATPGVEVIATSARTGAAVDDVAAHLGPGVTAVLLGMSGAGKSTLANRLLGRDALATQDVRRDDRGRHTTTARQLVVVPGGGVLIDTPGLRELGLWEAEEGLADAFADVEELAAGCRFNDCGHEREPGCAVREALASGDLDPERWDSYLTLRAEQEALARRRDARLRAEEQRRWKAINRSLRAFREERGR